LVKKSKQIDKSEIYETKYTINSAVELCVQLIPSAVFEITDKSVFPSFSMNTDEKFFITGFRPANEICMMERFTIAKDF